MITELFKYKDKDIIDLYLIRAGVILNLDFECQSFVDNLSDVEKIINDRKLNSAFSTVREAFINNDSECTVYFLTTEYVLESILHSPQAPRFYLSSEDLEIFRSDPSISNFITKKGLKANYEESDE